MPDMSQSLSDHPRTPNRRHLLRLVALGLPLALAACGKRGPLEPPPDSEEGRKLSSQRNQPQDPGQAGVPALKGARRRPPPITPPKQDFLLDFLL
jgi:predicted small lipoprotein YifL